MTVQCGSDETSHRPRLGPLPTPPLGRVRAPSMEPAALPIKSMALPFYPGEFVPWPHPQRSGRLCPPFRALLLPVRLPATCLIHPFHCRGYTLIMRLLSAFRRNGASVTAPGTGWSNVPAPFGHQPSSMVWDRSVRQLTIGRCRIPSPLHSPFSPPRPPRTGAKGSCRNDQRATADDAGFGWMPGCTPDTQASTSDPGAQCVAGGPQQPFPSTYAASDRLPVDRGRPIVGRLAFGIGRTPTSPAATVLSSGGGGRPLLPGWLRCQLLVSPSMAGAGLACFWLAWTWIRLACTSGALGTRICSTPSCVEASIASAMTWVGRVIERRKRP